MANLTTDILFVFLAVQLVIALLDYLVYKIDTHQRFWLRLHWGFGSDLGFHYVCGEVLDFCAKGIILKLADWMIFASGGAYDTKTVKSYVSRSSFIHFIMLALGVHRIKFYCYGTRETVCAVTLLPEYEGLLLVKQLVDSRFK